VEEIEVLEGPLVAISEVAAAFLEGWLHSTGRWSIRHKW